MKFIFSIIFFAIFIGGCNARTDQKFVPAPKPGEDQALVYFYRSYNPTDASFTPTVYINDKKFSDLPHYGYTWTYLAPGKYKIEAKSEGFSGTKITAGARLTVTGGKTYYLNYSVNRDDTSQAAGMFGGPLTILFLGYDKTPDTLDLMNPKTAENYIVNNYYVNPFKK